ncbi:dipeptide ABC transporter ATP-binding protein [Pseudarthrobacter sp. YAF2]|uniref:dipeptide ABC transporter ATP-binding protein n=1 Tax=Pseudarthrobacter sp. YAF2 TaxID=3233078 RepID=UPI003F94B18A
MSTHTSLLSMQDVSVTFATRAGDVKAVRNVSLELAVGETLAVVGESGSGKSTMAAAINRLLPSNGRVSSGKIIFEGRDLVELKEPDMVRLRGAGIGLVPQDPMSSLNPLHRVGDQISEVLAIHGHAKGAAGRQAAIDLLSMVGIHDAEKRCNQYPHEFSGGMRQRALIAMGLACRPKLLIADEPTSALDVTVQRKILDELEELTRKMGTSVFLITHDLALAAERADRIVVMYRGECVESGAAAQILEDPQHEYTKRLLSAAPTLHTASKSSAMSIPMRSPEDASGRGPQTENILEVKNLTKSFEIRSAGFGKKSHFLAVDDVSFSVPRGKTVSIVGESGSGKSTTANLVLALDVPTAGEILCDGDKVTSFSRSDLLHFRKKIQPVFQNPFASLDPRMSIGDAIAEPLVVHKIGDQISRRAKVHELLDQVGLPSSCVKSLPHELSGGQNQRVGIARALSLDPELVVLDEAVSALDVLVQDQILKLLSNLQSELGVSYLFISHDLAVVRMISDEVHVMRKGKIVESGHPEVLFEMPREEYTQELLAAIPGSRLVS